MSKRSEKILDAAIGLFSSDGFHAVSTARIARQAGVSEGLIFTHYQSKQGLLEAVIEKATHQLATLVGPILMERNPRLVVRKTIDLPFVVPPEDYTFWCLLFRLKWEVDFDSAAMISPLIDKLTSAFSELGYASPREEARLLDHIIDSIGANVIRGGLKTELPLRELLREQYQV